MYLPLVFALKGRSILAQGNALGTTDNIDIAALKGQGIYIRPTGGRGQEHSSLALTGRLMVLGASESQGGGSVSIDTVALPWAKMRCPFRAKNTISVSQIIGRYNYQ